MNDKDKIYESIANYTKFKVVEMLIEKHLNSKLDNINKVEEIADDILNVLSICGMKYYGELKQNFGDEDE